MKIQLLLVSALIPFLTSCAGLQKETQNCRLKPDLIQIRKEIVADIHERFPGYQSVAISEVGLAFDGSGTAFYPASVKLKTGELYSVIYNYSPENEQCKKLGFQYIKLDAIQ